MTAPAPLRIAGLDLSTKRVGFAAPDGELLSISAHAGAEDPYRRLHELGREIERAFRLRPPLPDLVVVEGYSLGMFGGGILSKIRLGEIGGIVRTRLFELGVAFVDVPPSSLKRFACSNGNAKKEQMIARAIELGARGNVNDDEADAFHLRRMGRAANGLEGPLADHELDSIGNAGVSW